MANSTDDEVLEVASELKQTLQGDFLEFRRQFIEKLTLHERPSHAKFELKTLTPPYMPEEVEGGHKLELKVSIPVAEVLAGRNVNPRAVVDSFQTEAGPSKAVELITLPNEGPCFRLTQILMIERPTYGPNGEHIYKRKE